MLILQSVFFFTTWKLKQTTEQQPHRAYDQTKPNQKQKQARRIQIDLAFYCSIYSTSSAIWYH